MKRPKLDEAPARTMTDRELAKVIGGMLGGLANQAETLEALKRAVAWWHPDLNPDAWTLIAQIESGAASASRN